MIPTDHSFTERTNEQKKNFPLSNNYPKRMTNKDTNRGTS